VFKTFIVECTRGSGGESDFLLKGYVKQEAGRKSSKAEHGTKLSELIKKIKFHYTGSDYAPIVPLMPEF